MKIQNNIPLPMFKGWFPGNRVKIFITEQDLNKDKNNDKNILNNRLIHSDRDLMPVKKESDKKVDFSSLMLSTPIRGELKAGNRLDIKA